MPKGRRTGPEKPPPPLPTRLSEARRRFVHWRNTDKKTAYRIPEDLWSLAVELAREYGLSKTSRALGLEYMSLKKHVAAATPGGLPEESTKKPLPPPTPDDDFATRLLYHFEATGVPKVNVASAINVKPKYIREVELRTKPPPQMHKVVIMADTLGLTGRDRELFIARGREGRMKPESREYFRSLEKNLTRLMDLFDIDLPERIAICEGQFNILHDRIRSTLLEANKIENTEDILPLVQTMRYNDFIKTLLSGLEHLRRNHSRKEVDWIQTELLKQMERMADLRKAESMMKKKLSRKQ